MAKPKQKKKKQKAQAQEQAHYDVLHKVKSSFLGKLEALWRIRVMLAFWGIWLCINLDLIPEKCNEDVLCQLILERMLQTPLAIISIYIMAGFIQVVSGLLLRLTWTLMVMVWPQWFLGILFPEERSVKQYVHLYGVVKEHKPRSGRKLIVCTKYGIHLWRGFIEVVVKAHRCNRSWGGKFSMQDLRLSGHRCRITREATCDGTKENLLLDLSTLADLLVRHFKDNGGPIDYIKELYNGMKKPDGFSSPAPTKEQFLKFLENHPALCSARQRIIFIFELYQAYESMDDKTEKQLVDIALAGITVGAWVRQTLNDNTAVLVKVLTYQKRNQNNTAPVYDEQNASELFRFLRNFHAHGGERKANGDQCMHDLEDLEYVSAYVHSTFICNLICQLIVHTDMSKSLQYAWKNYTEHTDF
ncbi:hypothetical protein ACQJBY_020854 [Aegilops geniculata]